MSYQKTWPGSLVKRAENRKFNPSPILFSSPQFNGTQNYDRVAFEADLPRIEAPDSGGNCNRKTGKNCVNPPPGAAFYPIYSTRKIGKECFWQLGGANIPGTLDTFGGNSTAEFGSLLLSVYPNKGFKPRFFVQ